MLDNVNQNHSKNTFKTHMCVGGGWRVRVGGWGSGKLTESDGILSIILLLIEKNKARQNKAEKTN